MATAAAAPNDAQAHRARGAAHSQGGAAAAANTCQGHCGGGGRPATVADMVGQHGTVVCGRRTTLAEAAAMLLASDRTSAVVAGEAGTMVGALTENDVLNAYSSGVPGHYTVKAWLESNCARVPPASMQALTVAPTTTLLEAAAHMKEQAEGEFACRHVIIKDATGSLRGILSCLDVVRALCATGSEAEVALRVGATAVGAVMKPRAALPTCSGTAALLQALEKMLAFQQNCVLVTEGEATGPQAKVLGVITTRDALRAFADHTPLGTACGRWLAAMHARVEPRLVPGDTPLAGAAARMSADSLHHLVVVSPQDASAVIGVVSSSDLAHALGGGA